MRQSVDELRRAVAVALVALLACGCSRKPAPAPPKESAVAKAPEPPRGPPQGPEAQAFTQRFIEFVRATQPGLRVTAVGELSVQGDKPGTLNLANLRWTPSGWVLEDANEKPVER